MLISSQLGAIAQLGERLHGMQEVVGSNPIGSTSRNLPQLSHRKFSFHKIPIKYLLHMAELLLTIAVF